MQRRVDVLAAAEPQVGGVDVPAASVRDKVGGGERWAESGDCVEKRKLGEVEVWESGRGWGR